MIEITHELLDELMARHEAEHQTGAAPAARKSGPKEITAIQAAAVFETRRPLGKFYFKQNGKFIGIDNTKGDAESGVFGTLGACERWLDE